MDLQEIFYIEDFEFNMIILPLVMLNFFALITVVFGRGNKTALMRFRDFLLIVVAIGVDIFTVYAYLVWIGQGN